ncbi:SGNH/GDSL hydrolase family protein [Alistipes sp.]|uniref:SGNH/GDSL hydrolase family protein n=1 Tax=Alistipes sp. TaxID=1872444 RepID=UPI003AB25947
MKKTAFLLALALPLLAAGQQRDWANYGRYAEANAALATAPAVVFMGNSITDGWDNAHPEFFTDNNFACRGIGGQVSSQMLCRFRADVIDLRPKAVVILAGTNDIAGNNGPIESEHIAENIVSMAELALAAGIRPIICSVLPAAKYPWRPEVESVPEKIRALNDRLRQYAAERGLTWVDYYSAMDAGDGSMRSEYTRDGVHPTPEGYAVMEAVIRPALAEWLP